MTAFRFVLAIWACLVFLPWPAAAAMEPAKDGEMDKVQARSGIAVSSEDVQVYMEKGYIAYEDTSGRENRFELSDILYSDGDGGPLRFSAPAPVTVQVAEDAAGRPVIAWHAPDWEQDFYADAESFTFAGQDLGSMHFHGIAPKESALYISPPDEGGTGGGVAFQLETRFEMEALRWAYNKDGEAFDLSGTHLAGSFDAEGDDPADPDTWDPDGRFIVGDMGMADDSNDDPARFLTVTDEADRGYVQVQMPSVSGSIRIEEVTMGDADLGPVILDDIEIHELNVDFVPFEQ